MNQSMNHGRDEQSPNTPAFQLGGLACAGGQAAGSNPYVGLHGRAAALSDTAHAAWIGDCRAWWRGWDIEEAERRRALILKLVLQEPRRLILNRRSGDSPESLEASRRWIAAFVTHVMNELPQAPRARIAEAARKLHEHLGHFDPVDVAEAEWEQLPLDERRQEA